MKKKRKTYILLTVVLGIWGTIGYQIFSKLSPDDSPALASNTDIRFTPKQTIEKDTFRINTEHRDPFLGKPYQQKRTSSTGRKASTIKKDPVVFPPIAYKGVISKQQSSENIYIIDISGTQQLFKLGKTIQEVKLLKGDKKSITISFKGKRKTISVSK
ncbi:hypothetical protein [uncultured Kordia sp.]|uniref:hypothetical protein n=1 Tax=uncultured Kordia sp. TaxID=507699 RepID=UPI002634A467|nr:hypothetical protein [uncultured Kordia sp.]